MGASTLSAIIASVALVAIIIGFLVGWVRGYQRSILALIITLVCAVLAFFIAPLISEAILNIKVNATVNGTAVSTLQEYAIEYLKSIEYIREAMESSETLAALIVALPAMVANILLFIVLFIVLKIVLGLILYLPIALTVFSKRRLENKSKIKLLGAGLGVLGSLVVLAVLFVPVFGAINIAAKTVAESSNETEAESTSMTREYDVVLVNDSNVVEVSSADDQIEKIMKQVKTYTDAFNNTWIIKLYRGIGVGALSEATFDKLSTKTVNGEQVSLSDEIAIASEMVPYGRQIMKVGFKINNDFIENIDQITKVAYKSKVISRVLSESASYAFTKWDNGQTFMGISKPEISESPVLNTLLSKVIKTMKVSDVDTIKEDVSAMISTLRVVVNAGLVNAVRGENAADKTIKILADNDKNVVENVIVSLTASNHYKAIIPEVINVGLDAIYKVLNVVPATDDTYYWVLANNSTNWSDEAEKIQEIVGKFCGVYQSYADKTSEEEIIDVIKFKDLGDVIDLMRHSSLFADQSNSLDGPGKKIYSGILNHKMLESLVTDEVKTNLINKYSQTNVNVSDTFAEVDNMIAVAKKLAEVAGSISEGGIEKVSKENITTILNSITDESSVIGTMVSEENLTNLGVDEDVITEITKITGKLATASAADKANEVEGIATVLDLAMQAQQNGGNIVIANTDDLEPEEAAAALATAADNLVSSIKDSTIISTMLKDSNSIVSDVSVGGQLDTETKAALAESINTQIPESTENNGLRAALASLFGVALSNTSGD
ncbi:MAG: hypothetical protein J5689_03200 [Clostridia bacterium]|nr:hypothetical protein [Clostridia bacterium]